MLSADGGAAFGALRGIRAQLCRTPAEEAAMSPSKYGLSFRKKNHHCPLTQTECKVAVYVHMEHGMGWEQSCANRKMEELI